MTAPVLVLRLFSSRLDLALRHTCEPIRGALPGIRIQTSARKELSCAMSTFAFESQALLVDGDYWRAFLYMGATLIGCLAFTFAGIWLADRLL